MTCQEAVDGGEQRVGVARRGVADGQLRGGAADATARRDARRQLRRRHRLRSGTKWTFSL